jgi:Haem-NO-binding
VYGLGVFTAETTFARLYLAFFAQTPTPRAFLLTVEERIHELIRATIPRAGPPRLAIAALGEEGVRIRYSSPRRLCLLLRGLTKETAAALRAARPARRARVHAPG